MTEHWAVRAHALARLFHGEDAVAAKVVAGAFARLDAAEHTQRKRLYYAPRSRSRTYLPRPALLHMLVLSESEPYERIDECAGQVPERTLIARYVKHLVCIGAKRNSFHLALAVFRLLFNYDTAETMNAYELLLDEDDFVKEDYYYRARKRVLMGELEQRFPALERVQGRQSEERFVMAARQEQFADVVYAALEACTPWGTTCGDPASSQDAETQRLHALVHPPCLEALVARAGLPSPRARLAVPQLALVTAPV